MRTPTVTECFKCGVRVKSERERESMVGRRCPEKGCTGSFHVRETHPRPPCPPVPDAVREWAEERIGAAGSIGDALEAFVGQMPAHVVEWLEAHRAWSRALDRWAAGLPVHVVNDRWRMFGGPWLSTEETVRVPGHGGYAAPLLVEVQAAWEVVPDDEETMRAIAEAVYARRDAVRAADKRIVAATDLERLRSARDRASAEAST